MPRVLIATRNLQYDFCQSSAEFQASDGICYDVKQPSVNRRWMASKDKTGQLNASHLFRTHQYYSSSIHRTGTVSLVPHLVVKCGILTAVPF